MTKTTFQKGVKISTTILLSTILIGFTFVGANIMPAFAGDPPLCGFVITSNVKLTHNYNCTDATGGITIGADNVKIDLNGWAINCTGAGYLGSCQGTGAIGIDTNGHNNITIKGPGTINGFEFGVLVNGGSNINVMNLFVTGPVSPGAGNNDRPQAQGIRVQDTVCPNPLDTIVNIKGNDVTNHREGIALIDANCVNVHRNSVSDNNSDPVECSGILLVRSNNNNIGHNDVFQNGENLPNDGGIIVRTNSDNNTIQSNDVFDNFGSGISIRTGSDNNQVTNNNVGQGGAGAHTFFGGDLSELGAVAGNTYPNNCYTNSNIAPAPAIAKKCPKNGVGA